jgi:hypothetical protein
MRYEKANATKPFKKEPKLNKLPLPGNFSGPDNVALGKIKE